MILRPVSPQSPCGPPSRKQPVGLMWQTMSSSSIARRLARRHHHQLALDQVGRSAFERRQDELVDDHLPGVVGEESLPSFVAITLSSCCVERTTVWMRCGVPSALYSTVTWLLASGRSELQLAARAQLGVVLDQAVGQVDRQRHQRRASRRRRSRTSCPGRRPRRCPRPWRCRGDWAWRWQIDLAGVGGEADLGIDVADLADHVADELVDGAAATGRPWW